MRDQLHITKWNWFITTDSKVYGNVNILIIKVY